jgi:hypothetical protein
VVIDWCYGFYNPQRRHSAAAGRFPINHENAARTRQRHKSPPRSRGNYMNPVRRSLRIMLGSRSLEIEKSSAAGSPATANPPR